MKKLTIVLLFASFHPLFSQADLLPQIFGTLPIEFSQGLPEGMSYQEYRMAMRNVDFMTMGMSMILPGYGFFQVERPVEATGIIILRGVGMGMMGYAMYDQWAHISDIFQLQSLSSEDLERVTRNGFIMMGGMFLQFVGWGIDTVGAYHIAKAEKDWVLYKYGMAWSAGYQSPEGFRLGVCRI